MPPRPPGVSTAATATPDSGSPFASFTRPVTAIPLGRYGEARELADAIYHVDAKDTLLDPHLIARNGVLDLPSSGALFDFVQDGRRVSAAHAVGEVVADAPDLDDVVTAREVMRMRP